MAKMTREEQLHANDMINMPRANNVEETLSTALAQSGANLAANESSVYGTLVAPVVDTATVLGSLIPGAVGDDSERLLKQSRAKQGYYEENPSEMKVASAPGQLAGYIPTYLTGAGLVGSAMNVAAKTAMKVGGRKTLTTLVDKSAAATFANFAGRDAGGNLLSSVAMSPDDRINTKTGERTIEISGKNFGHAVVANQIFSTVATGVVGGISKARQAKINTKTRAEYTDPSTVSIMRMGDKEFGIINEEILPNTPRNKEGLIESTKDTGTLLSDIDLDPSKAQGAFLSSSGDVVVNTKARGLLVSKKDGNFYVMDKDFSKPSDSSIVDPYLDYKFIENVSQAQWSKAKLTGKIAPFTELGNYQRSAKDGSIEVTDSILQAADAYKDMPDVYKARTTKASKKNWLNREINKIIKDVDGVEAGLNKSKLPRGITDTLEMIKIYKNIDEATPQIKSKNFDVNDNIILQHARESASNNDLNIDITTKAGQKVGNNEIINETTGKVRPEIAELYNTDTVKGNDPLSSDGGKIL